ncbi:MAG: RNA polymerase sigma factor [Bacteroidia bacterium]|nr:RNA polymerase sigma factor [Bacteroidia bacterium]
MNNPDQEISDESLMILVQHGDENALGVLYNRYADRIYNFLNKKLYSSDENAEDALHDIFLKVIRSSGQFKVEKSFKTWIYSIANNHCKNLYSSIEVRKRYSENNRVELVSDENIISQIDRNDLEVAINTKIKMLSEAQQSLFHLRFTEDLAIKDIAKILDCPVGTVKSRLHYLVKEIATCMAAYNNKI